MVRPWKEPSAATRWVRPVRRVSLKAASLASVPELVKNTRPPVARSTSASSRSASSTWGALVKKFETWPRVVELLGDGRDQRGVGVAEGVDGDAAEQVDVLLAVGVPDVRTLAADEDQLRRPEGVHHGAGVALLPLLAHESRLAFRTLVATPGSTWVPTPSSVNSSSSTAWSSRPSTTVARATPPLHRLEARGHLRHHAAGQRGHQLGQRLGSDLADHVVAVGPVAVEPLDVGEHDAASRRPARSRARRRRCRRSRCGRLPSSSGATLEMTGIRPASTRSSTASGRTLATSPTRPRSTSSPSTIGVGALRR